MFGPRSRNWLTPFFVWPKELGSTTKKHQFHVVFGPRSRSWLTPFFVWPKELVVSTTKKHQILFHILLTPYIVAPHLNNSSDYTRQLLAPTPFSSCLLKELYCVGYNTKKLKEIYRWEIRWSKKCWSGFGWWGGLNRTDKRRIYGFWQIDCFPRHDA